MLDKKIREKLRGGDDKMNGKPQPFFSVIIPTYNRPIQLADCLRALTKLDYPYELFEVVVVDDGSPVPPEDVTSGYRDRMNIRFLNQMNSGPAAARNKGAAGAKGRFLAFTDDDCTPAPDWLKILAAGLGSRPDNLFCGRTVNRLTSNPYSVASQMLVDYLSGYHNLNSNRARFFTSNNFAVAAERFRATGGFDVRYRYAAGEDREFCRRWLSSGFQITYAPKAVIHHAHALTFHTFCHQHFLYGRAAFRFLRAGVGPDQPGLKMEPPIFYLKLLVYPFLRVKGPRTLFFTELVLISQAATAAGFFREAARRKKQTLP